MGKSIRNKAMDRLFEGILTLKDVDECYDFFNDVCTVNELQALAQRLEVAEMLKLNKTYNEICEKTGASTATISRVNRALNYGEEGYAIVIHRLREKDAK